MINFWVVIVVLGVVCMVGKAIWQDSKTFAPWVKPQWQKVLVLWREATFLKKIYIILVPIVGFVFLILLLNLYSIIFLLEWKDRTTPTSANIQNFTFNLLGIIISGTGTLFGVYWTVRQANESKRQNDVTQRQAHTTEQWQITDRISKATEALGKNNNDGNPLVEPRLGALYALERIAKDSIRDHVGIMEILCAYIRYNSPDMDNGLRPPPLREDIQAALIIIGRRENWPEGTKRLDIEKQQKYTIKLNNCDLHGARLSGANLSGAEFMSGDQNHVFFDNANLRGALFYDTHMHGALICNSDISDASFSGANMKHVITEWAYAKKCDISCAENLTQEQLNQMFLGKDVELPKGLNHPQEKTKYYKDYDTDEDFFAAYKKWLDEEKIKQEKIRLKKYPHYQPK